MTNEIICRCKQVTKGDIIKAMADGAKNIDDIKEKTSAGTGCGYCVGDIEKFMDSVICGCRNVSLKEITTAVSEGAITLDEVASKTSATQGCGRCTTAVQQIVESAK